MPLFSVITPTYQCAAKLTATVESVLAQPGHLFEYLLVDGASTDGTWELIEGFLRRASNLRAISEKDGGIYDAMNKGVRLTTGRFLYFLGAGDRLRPGALEAVARNIEKLDTQGKGARPMLLYGNVSWPGRSRSYDGRFNRLKILRRNICHQAIFYHRPVFERLGLYDTAYRYLADWELNIRCFNDRRIATRYLPLQVAEYEGGGISNLANDPAFHRDFRRIARRQCRGWDAWLMRLGFFLAHPRALAFEPSRLLRRWRHARAKP